MKKQVILEFTEEDIERIRIAKTEPCNECSAGVGCCGCPAHKEWEETHGKLDPELKEFAKAYIRAKRDIRVLHELLHDIKQQLPILRELKLQDGSTPLLSEIYEDLNRCAVEASGIAGEAKGGNNTGYGESKSLLQCASSIADR